MCQIAIPEFLQAVCPTAMQGNNITTPTRTGQMIADYFIHWTFDYPEPVQLLHGGVSDNLNFTVAVATTRLATKRRMETEERKTKRETSRIEVEESAERLETKCLKKARLKQGQSKRRGTMSAPSQS